MTGLKSFSIRRRIFTVACLLLIAATLALIAFLRGYAHSASDQAFDRLLAASALTIAGSVQMGDDGVTVEPPFSSLAMMSGQERVFYSVRDPAGEPITGYDDLAPALPLAASATPVFADQRYHDDPIRVVTVGRLVSAAQHVGWVTVRVAETRGAREVLAAEILNRSVVPLVALVLVALALIWFGLRLAFSPLRTMERALRERAPDDLRAFDAPVPRETQRLVEALNAFMHRLSGVMATLNDLVADAAHQVRTPLASLRAQAEVALDEPDPERLRERVVRIHRNATQASDLINQLLMDATISHRLGTHGRDFVGVAETINETRRRIGPLQVPRLKISIAPDVRRARISGDRLALREMLRNLVDNALRYAPDGDVEIHATPVSNYRVAITVLDRGPGVADDEKETVQARFVRGRSGADSSGSGLGLAIVRNVAEMHGGSLRLQDRAGGGLSARVVLPLARGRVHAGGNISRPMSAHPTTARPAPDRTAPVTRALVMFAFVSMTLLLGHPDARAMETDAPALTTEPGTTAVPRMNETRYPAPRPSGRTLVIAGPTDTPVVVPVIRGFQEERPDVDVVYREMGGREAYDATVAGKLNDVDVLMSSVADLQVRLANDGFAMQYASPQAARLPTWAKWRDEVFGFTFEPAVWIYNPDRFTEATIPRTRQDLVALLEREHQSLQGRVGTYDIAVSGVGYLLAEQDELLSSNFWGLTNALGRVDTRLSATSAGILDAVERGDMDIGYNVLGSYALARQAEGARIGVVFPRDYVLVLARSVLIMRRAPRPELARALVDYLLSPAGQSVASSQSGLGSIMEDTPGRWTAEKVLARSQGIVQPVVMSPALLVGLDRRRHSRFIQNWSRLITDTGISLIPPTAP